MRHTRVCVPVGVAGTQPHEQEAFQRASSNNGRSSNAPAEVHLNYTVGTPPVRQGLPENWFRGNSKPGFRRIERCIYSCSPFCYLHQQWSTDSTSSPLPTTSQLREEQEQALLSSPFGGLEQLPYTCLRPRPSVVSGWVAGHADVGGTGHGRLCRRTCTCCSQAEK